MFYLYIIRSEKTGKYYIGSTGNIENRIRAHNMGKTKSTKGFIPYKLVYKEEYLTNTEARKRENFIKSKKSREYIEGLICRGVA